MARCKRSQCVSRFLATQTNSNALSLTISRLMPGSFCNTEILSFKTVGVTASLPKRSENFFLEVILAPSSIGGP